MSLPDFSPVRLTTDRFAVSDGVSRGAIGVILDVYGDGYEVEFSRPDGTTIASFAVTPGDVETVPDLVEIMTDRSTV